MNPITTSLTGVSPATGIRSQERATDVPSFASVLPVALVGVEMPPSADHAAAADLSAAYPQSGDLPAVYPPQSETVDGAEEGVLVAPQFGGMPQPLPTPGVRTPEGEPVRPMAPASTPLTVTECQAGTLRGEPSPPVMPLPAAQAAVPAAAQPQSGASQVPWVGQLAVEGINPSSRTGGWQLLTATAVTAVEATELAPRMAEGDSRATEALSPSPVSAHVSRGSQWGPLPLDPSGGAQQLGRQMLAPLREQLRFSLEQGITKAEVRLDPPELGRIDLSVRHEGDRITVQLTAANPLVREALAAGAERLRGEMAQGVGHQVQVDVGRDAPRERQQEHSGWGGPRSSAPESTTENAAVERDLVDMLA
ncbi:flagellar hook-length control protein FliK [Ferrimonas sediminicola]|uniref:Flagellar hook-length control protein FliK n=1 Tax=Ferrimonas sediminicola TaxID=2569538 RepID=A0A4U1BAK7_9GAMM|nr:flagellar hook-length control protein FliK [Ferrimonas sediminicola]TKB47807.1 flagellar hook-length control protein FliK [Ferrimonas sediminicola]